MNVKKICACGLGVALYVTVSMMLKIPVMGGHTALDLGYVVFAVYCYWLGPVAGMAVGGIGCMFVSLLASGWFPVEWIAGNLLIGLVVGLCNYKKKMPMAVRMLVTVIAVMIGIAGVKTVVACVLYDLPWSVKLAKNAVVGAMDAVVMCLGTWLAPRLPVPGWMKDETPAAAGRVA